MKNTVMNSGTPPRAVGSSAPTAPDEVKVDELPILLVAPPHPFEDGDKLERIMTGMGRYGWRGRPLLVLDLQGGDQGDLYSGYDIRHPWYKEALRGRAIAERLMPESERVQAIADYETAVGVSQGDGPPVPRYHALTGSHRYAAACAAGLRTIPCVYVDLARLGAAGYRVVDLLGNDDGDVLRVLYEVGDEAAARLMQIEFDLAHFEQ